MRSIPVAERWRRNGAGVRRVLLAVMLLSVPATGLVAQVQTQLVIRGLKFKGNKSIDPAILAASIRTTNSSFFARAPILRNWFGEKRYFNQRDFQADVLRLGVLYRRSGFPDVVVDTVVERSPESVKLTFNITEGAPIRISRLEIVGLDTSRHDASSMTRDLPVVEGDVFSQYKLFETADTLGIRLLNDGYPNATVDVIFGEADTVAHLRPVTLRAEPGQRAVYGTTRVVGNATIDSALIASLVTAREGHTYRYRDVFRSQRSLYGSELFRLATVGIDTARFTPGDSIVPMLAVVEEGPFRRTRGSVGYGTTDCVRAGAGWTRRNFLGQGRVLDLSGRLTKIGIGRPLGMGFENSICSPLADDSVGSREVNYSLNASLRRNGFLSPDNTGVVAVFVERRSEYNVYQREEFGVSASVTRETASRLPITLTYRAAYGQTRANDASFCAFFNACAAADIVQLRERRWLTTLSLTATRQRVNNVLDPTRGNSVSAEVTLSSKLLGSSAVQQFTRIVAEAARYTPLTRDIVLATHVRAGYIFAPRTNFGGGSNFIPPDQRFYAGGPNDVRGYDRNELGPLVYVVPRDSLTPVSDSFPLGFKGTPRPAATGGNRLAVANVELRLPSPIFRNRMRFATFVDAGIVGDGRSGGELRITPGIGVRFASPLGPIRFDAGYNRYRLAAGPVYTTSPEGDLIQIRENFSRENSGGRWTLHFSVGQAF